MSTRRKPSAWLALLLCWAIAMPPAALCDDTELFTTSANPNVLLMVDTSGSMNTVAGGVSVGDLDGDGTSNTRTDILWKVIYTLLNADLSIPSGTSSITCTLYRARRWGSSTIDTSISNTRQYQYVEVRNISSTDWNLLPAAGTVEIGSFSTHESMTYTSRSSGSPRRFYFSSAKSFTNSYANGTTISYTYSPIYSYPYPVNNTQAVSLDFRNNLTMADDNILKARLGLMTFTAPWGSPDINIRSQISSDNNISPNTPPFYPTYKNIWDNVTAYVNHSGATPAALALYTARGFFDTATANNTVDLCRQNYAVLITDGEDTIGGIDGATGTGGGPGYYDGGWPGGTFYSDGYSGNTGQVARNNAVILEAASLLSYSPSIKLFSVGIGISGTEPHLTALREVLRRAAEQGNAQGTATEFTNIGNTGDNTLRGAGRAFFASDANDLSVALRNVFQQITAGMYSFTAPTVATVRLTDRNYLYKATFTPVAPPATFWEGHLIAYVINNDNTLTSQWDAGTVLASTTPGSRRIYTSDNVWNRLEFTTSNVTTAMLGADNTAHRDSIVNYVRGANHDNTSKLGDIFHSKPVVVGPPSRFYFDNGYSVGVPTGVDSYADAKSTRKRVVYVGTNDGMLHAFLSGTYNPATGLYDSGTGEELFGYVPNGLLDSLRDFLPGELTRHGFFVDSSPRAADVWIDSNGDGIKQSSEWRTVLIGGLRKGGTSYFALDVTEPPSGSDYSNYPRVLWEYADAANVGQTWSEPFIGKIKMKDNAAAAVKDRWVAFFGGGKSDSGTIGASFVVMDIATGTPLKTFTSGIDNMIISSPTGVLDVNGYVRFVYVPDRDGSLMKFDFRTTGIQSTGFPEWTAVKIFQAPSGGQPVYHRVESATIDANNRYLYFGTGNQDNPVTDGGTGKFFAIKDNDSSTVTLIQDNLANLSSSITSLSGGAPTQYGWYVNFATVPSTSVDNNTHTAEKVLSDPVVFYNNVYFTTFTPDTSNPCGGGGIARVYGLQMLNAGAALTSLAALGETGTKVPYHTYTGGIPSSASLSISTDGASITVGLSGAAGGNPLQIPIDSPPRMKTIKSWKETF
jgi:hypothetical protein